MYLSQSSFACIFFPKIQCILIPFIPRHKYQVAESLWFQIDDFVCELRQMTKNLVAFARMCGIRSCPEVVALRGNRRSKSRSGESHFRIQIGMFSVDSWLGSYGLRKVPSIWLDSILYTHQSYKYGKSTLRGSPLCSRLLISQNNGRCSQSK